jgi:hypothetical protein
MGRASTRCGPCVGRPDQGLLRPFNADQPEGEDGAKHFSRVDAVPVGMDRMQRNFEPLARHIELVRQAPLTEDAAKLIIYQAFIEGGLEVPRHLAPAVHQNYFRPKHKEFEARTAWSLSNAFTSAFKELDAVPQFRATAKLGPFLYRVVR